MKRVLIGVLVFGLVAVIGAFTLYGATAVAEEGRHMTVEVTFRTPDDMDEKAVEGDSCGFVLPPVGSTDWPLGKQVLIRDASGTIVGTVDLADVFDLTQSKDTRPGKVASNGFCVVTETVEVMDSPFYTFTVDGQYNWTMSREDLKSRDWTMPVLFVPNP